MPFAVLILPRLRSSLFFELVSDLVDMHWDEGADFAALLAVAETRI